MNSKAMATFNFSYKGAYSAAQAAERQLNDAIGRADISRSFEEYLEIFDRFYADEIIVSSEAATPAAQGKDEVGLQRHQAVSPEDFLREPHRNRYASLLGRTAHLAYHFGQVMLAKRS